MSVEKNIPVQADNDAFLNGLDFATLIGKDIQIFSEQIAGEPVNSKVLQVNKNVISVDRSGSGGLIDSLVNKQAVTLCFVYKGEPVAIRGTLKKTNGGICNITLEEKARPLALRKFKRFDIIVPVKMAKITKEAFVKAKSSSLRWLEIKTTNISAGGLLLELSAFLEPGTYLLINVAIPDVPFPSLILGQIRYCLKSDFARFLTGVEFITKEMSCEHFEPAVYEKLPKIVLEFDETRRTEVGAFLMNYENKS